MKETDCYSQLACLSLQPGQGRVVSEVGEVTTGGVVRGLAWRGGAGANHTLGAPFDTKEWVTGSHTQLRVAVGPGNGSCEVLQG